MHSIGSALRTWREQKKLSQKDAAAHFGVPSRTYQDYERDLKSPGAGSIEAFVRAGINANWLLTGEGSMLLSAAAQSQSLGGMTQSQVLAPVAAEAAHYVTVPLYDDIRAAAGAGAHNGQVELADDAMMFKDDWIRLELGARPENLCLIRVSGDSMEPTLRAGDVILIDRSAGRPDREGIYVLRLEDALLVKRLQLVPGGSIKVTSDNAAFEPWTINRSSPPADLTIVGRVIWSGRRF